MKRLDQLTVTRFLAALVIVVYHNGRRIFPFNTFPVTPLFTSGFAAVGFFFILSGFVMSLVYYRPEEKFNFKEFWLARFSRIYPIFLVAFFLACIHFVEATIHARAREYLSALFVLQAWVPDYVFIFNFPAWSLAVEAFFYLLFPFLAILMARSKLSARAWIWISIAFWAVNQFILFYLARTLPNTPTVDNLLSYFPLSHLSVFILGVASGMWYVQIGQHQPANQTVTRGLLLLGLGLAATSLLVKGSVGTAINKGVIAPFSLIVILTLVMETGFVSRALSHPWLVRLGDASYGVYILHMPIRWILEDLERMAHVRVPGPVFFYTYALILVSLALLLYNWLELPSRDWLRHNSRRLWLIFGDMLLLALALSLSYLTRVGFEIRGYADSLNFALRIGLPAYLILLLLFRAYSPISAGGLLAWTKRTLLPVAILGAAALAGLMFLALRNEWIHTFPRSMLAVNLFLSIGLLFGYRTLLQRWKPALVE